MEYTIQHREDQSMVVATAKGEWNSKADNDMVREIMETIAASGSRKVLLDIRELHFDLPFIQIFERAKEMREKRRQSGIASMMTAILYSSTNEKLDKDLTFFETTSRNRGLPYRTFTDMESAMAWLLSQT